MRRPFKVLFLCAGNSCRSQMAEGWARHLVGDLIEAHSAGVALRPLDQLAVRVMREAGVDVSEQCPKHVDDLKHLPFDCVVTVCRQARESCPLFPGRAILLHVGFDDPPVLAKSARTEEEALSHYRRVRDEIKALVERLPKEIERSGPAGTKSD